MKNQEKLVWGREKKVWASGLPRLGIVPSRHLAVFLPSGSTRLSWSFIQNRILFGSGWMVWTNFPLLFTTRALRNTNTKEIVILMLPYPKSWSRTLLSQTTTCEGSQEEPRLSLFPLHSSGWGMQLYRRSGSQTHPLSYVFSALNDGKGPRLDHRSLENHKLPEVQYISK